MVIVGVVGVEGEHSVGSQVGGDRNRPGLE